MNRKNCICTLQFESHAGRVGVKFRQVEKFLFGTTDGQVKHTYNHAVTSVVGTPAEDRRWQTTNDNDEKSPVFCILLAQPKIDKAQASDVV